MAKITIVIEDIEGGAAAQVTYSREPAGRLTNIEGAADIAGLAALGLLYSEVDTSVGIHEGDNEQLELPFGDEETVCECGCDDMRVGYIDDNGELVEIDFLDELPEDLKL
jgi:hypothetical protein